MALTWVERVAAKHSETIRALEKLRLKNQPPPPPKNGKGKVNIDLLKKLGVLRAPARTFGLSDRRTQIEDNPFRARPPQIEPPFREPPLEEGDTNPFRRGRFPAGVSERVTAPSTLVRAPTGELKPPLGEARRFPSPSEIELLGANVEELPPPKRFRPPGEVVGELLETPPGQIATGVVSLAAIVMGVGIPAAQQSWRSLTNLALMRQISRWAMERNIAVSKDEAQVMANQMRNYATQKGFKWDLDKRVLRDIFKATDGRTVPTQEATRQAEETAQQVVNRFAPAIIPRGTQTGAMVFGGREVRLSKAIWDATPVSQRVAQAESAGLAGQVGSKAFEALTVAERTALGRGTAPGTPPKVVGGFVAPTPKGSVEQALEAGIKQAKKTGQNVYVFPTAEGMKLGKEPPPFRLQHYIVKPDGSYEYIKPAIPRAETVTPTPEVTAEERLQQFAIKKDPISAARQLGYEVHKLSPKDTVDAGAYSEGYRYRLSKPKEGQPYPDIVMAKNEKEIGDYLVRQRAIPKAEIPKVGKPVTPEVRFTSFEKGAPPANPQEMYNWARGALVTDEMSRRLTQATTAPRLTAKNRAAALKIIREGEKAHPEWKQAYEAQAEAAIQPTETGGRVVPPTQPPVPIGGEGGIRPPLTTLPPETIKPAVTAEPQAQRVPPIEPPPPTKPPTAKIPEPTPPSGRPRTLADLHREAKGMRALKSEERAAVMDIARPISEGELLYEVKPFEEHAKNLLGPDTPIKEALRSLPGVKQVVGLWTPAQMERDNPIAMIGVRKQIFEEIEIGRARLATLNWWHDAEDAFSFKQIKGKWRATNVETTSSADVSKPYHATIHDLVEHPENYNFTPEQQRVLQIAQDMQRQIMRDAQRAGVDAVELFNDYWRRIVIKAPSTKIDAKTRGRISQRKGYTRQRVFDFVDEGAKAGYEYETHPLTALQNRLEAGIRTISDQETRQAIVKLPGVEKPLERLESRYPQTVAGARQGRQARDAAKTAFLRDKTVENETALRQAEADYIMAMKEIYAKKLEVGQPNIGELKLPNGRIAPAELVDEVRKWVDLPEIQTSRGTITNPMLQITRLVRTTLTNVDLAAGFIQGQVLFYRNNVAWLRGQANALVSLIDDPTAYVAKNFDAMDEGMRMGAISIPTEFLFTRQGLASIPTRIPVAGPAMKAFNRAFEWFILTGQTELYKAARGAAIRRAGGDVSSQKATDALVSLGSAIRKELGTESYAILGVRPTQHTAEQLLFFAARFFRALTGFQAQAFTGGEAGHEARRAWGSMLAGGLALTIAISYLKDREMPNLTDPFKPGWLSVKIGNTYFNAFGPYYSYLRTQARVGVYVSQGRFDEAANQLNYFMQSKAGLPLRGIDMAAQFGVKGYYTTFEGKTLPKTPLGVTEAALGEFAVPISIQEALKSLPEGRPESAIAEVFGLVGRENYPYFPEEMLSTYFDIPSSAIELRAGKEDGTIEFSREEYRKEFPPIDAMLFLKGYVTTIKTEEARQFVLDIVRREGYDPRQLRAVKKWQGEQDKLKELGLEDENITLTDSLIMELLGIPTRRIPEEILPSRGLPERGLPSRGLPERTLPSRGLPPR